MSKKTDRRNDESDRERATAPKEAIEFRLNDSFDAAIDESDASTYDELDEKAAEYLERVKSEARQVVENARAQIKRLRDATFQEIDAARESLNERAAALEAARTQLKADAEALEDRWNQLEREAFDSAKAQGLEQGVQLGKVEGNKLGRQEARAEFEAEVAKETQRRLGELKAEALAPTKSLISEMSAARCELLKNWEQNVLQIAAAIAYQTIMREPTILREVPLDLLREALELAMNCSTLKIRMNPRDVANLRESLNALLEETGNLAKSELVADPKVSVGGCVGETSMGVVDERLESRLERIIAELSE